VKQFILGKKPDKDGKVRLEGKDYHYLVRVKRLAVGEYFPALLPDGKEILVQVLSIDKKTVTGKCSRQEEKSENTLITKTPFLPPVFLFQALPKADKMDIIVRQAAEGEITEVIPFVSEFSVAKTGAGQKFSRWQRIIKEARQQSGSKTATTLRSPVTINELFDYWKELKEKYITGNQALGLLFHHNNLHSGGLEHESLHSYLNNVPRILAMAIGPEGGFSEKEVSLFLENGFKPFTIGNTILRTETAALYCAAVMKILLLERDSWELKQLK